MSVTGAVRLHALVPCAGTGARAGSTVPKQYLRVAGRPVVAHTLDALQGVNRLASIVVVIAPDDDAFASLVPLPAGTRTAAVRCGRPSRRGSVVRGLESLAAGGAADTDWVLVHDAARCLLRPAWVDRLIDACEHDAVGGLLALPVADTLKRGADGRVRETLQRQDAWQAQTPQMFRLGMLRSALAAAGEDVTDEAGAMEAAGHAPKLVPGCAENFKLTYPEDVEMADILLQARLR